MVTLTSFTFISLNGFYKSLNEEIHWHEHGNEEAEYSVESLSRNNTLLFGRATFDMMKSFWTSQMAYNLFPEVALQMNNSSKIVISKSIMSSNWNNTSVINDYSIERITELKRTHHSNITLLGSGYVLNQLANANLIDEFQVMIDPVLLEHGIPFMNTLSQTIYLELIKSRIFKSGVILNYYKTK